jgi:hypothetical protein
MDAMKDILVERFQTTFNVEFQGGFKIQSKAFKIESSGWRNDLFRGNLGNGT